MITTPSSYTFHQLSWTFNKCYQVPSLFISFLCSLFERSGSAFDEPDCTCWGLRWVMFPFSKWFGRFWIPSYCFLVTSLAWHFCIETFASNKVDLECPRVGPLREKMMKPSRLWNTPVNSRRSAAGSARTKVTRCHKRKCRCRSRSNILRHNHPKTLYLAQFLCL